MNAKERIATNPFHVLGLRPDATRVDVERESQRLIAMIEVGLKDAGSYASPTGGMPRDADAVRAAAAELRDPERRLVHELWAALAPEEDALFDTGPERVPGLTSAPVALGWRGR